MKSGIRLLTMLGAIVVAFSQLPSAAYAQATRTWVSGVGDDANPCSRTAPCKTFAGAISKTAAGGEINALDPAGFGALTITKAITLDGGGGQVASVLVSGTNGIIINAGASDTVTLRNLRMNGLGTGLDGIRYLGGAALIIENLDVFGFTTGINIVPSANTNRVGIRNTTVTNSISGGINFANGAGTVNATLTNVWSVKNGFGLGVTPTGTGVASVEIEHTTTSENVGNGIQVSGNGAVQMNNSAANHNNSNGVSITSPANVVSFGTNVIAANANNVLGTLTPATLK